MRSSVCLVTMVRASQRSFVSCLESSRQTAVQCCEMAAKSSFGLERTPKDLASRRSTRTSALVGSASIMRNFFAGRELTFGFGILNTRAMNAVVMDVLLNTVRIAGIDSPDLLVEALSGGQRQAVAIARAVYFKTAMLLLDEPTSALSVRETNKLLSHLGDLKREGVSAVFITHNLYHAFESCDRFTILSRGRVIRSVAKADTSLEQLNELIVKY